MTLYLVDLELDGYEDDKEREEAEIMFIIEQLDYSASSISVKKYVKE